MKSKVNERELRRHHVECIVIAAIAVFEAHPKHASMLIAGMGVYLTEDERSRVRQRISLLWGGDGAMQ